MACNFQVTGSAIIFLKVTTEQKRQGYNRIKNIFLLKFHIKIRRLIICVRSDCAYSHSVLNKNYRYKHSEGEQFHPPHISYSCAEISAEWIKRK